MTRPRRVPPPVYLAATLILVISIGVVLLRLPAAQEGESLGWVGAIFTATSAACVTGLVVVDTGSHFSGFGQAVILALIQVGGIGVMTIGTMVILIFGHRPTPTMRQLLRGLSPHRPTLRVRDVLGMVVVFTAGVEIVGALLLFIAFARDFAPGEAAWLAVFHSVSAFCNAGFGLWPDSLSRYAGDPLVNATIMGLITAGNLGFVVLVEMRQWAASRMRRRGAYIQLSLHAKIILFGTLVANLAGAMAFLVLESNNVLASRPWGEQLLAASFQSVTTRTAGFNTIDIAALTNPTLLIFIALMFIGAGPGSTAGGIKLTSAAAVLALVADRLRDRRQVRLFGRAIGELTLQRAVVLVVLASLMIGFSVVAIELVRSRGAMDLTVRGELFEVVFETVSAFGTVGLSMGITPKLEATSQVILVVLMFAGRLGPLILMDFFEHLPAAPPVRYASEELMVG